MGKRKGKRKLTAAEKAARRKRRQETRIIFVNGKQKRVPREPMIEGLPADEFLRRNADPIWLMQEGLYEELEEGQRGRDESSNAQVPDDGPEFKSEKRNAARPRDGRGKDAPRGPASFDENDDFEIPF